MTIALPFAVIPTPLGTVTTGNERAEKPATAVGEFEAPGLTWSSNGNSSVWIRIDYGVAVPIDFVAILAANALPGTTIRVRLGDTQAEVDGTADYDSTAVAFINPSIARKDGLYHSHLELPSVQTKRWLRIDIGGHTGDFEASMLVVGQKLTPANFYEPGWARAPKDLGSVDISPYGVSSDTPGVIWRSITATFGWMSEADYETMFGPLVEQLGARGIVFFCLNPAATTYRQSKTYFGRFATPSVATHSRDTPAGLRYQQEYEILSMF